MAAYLDARELLARGEDPLGAALRLAATVADGEGFTLDAPFDPMPMRNLLSAQGFSSTIQPAPEGGMRVQFVRDGRGVVTPAGQPEVVVCDGVPQWQEDGRTHVDVRGLTPPLPMIAILRVLKTMRDIDVLVVHHDRDPIYLHPELAEIGWRAERIDGEPGEVRLLVVKAV